MSATKTKRPKKSRPGNSNADLPPDQPLIPVADDDIPTVICPKCKAKIPDHDGFGFVHCSGCGNCTHPHITDGVCGICGQTIPPLADSVDAVLDSIPVKAGDELLEEIVNAAEFDAAKAAEDEYKSAKALEKYDRQTRKMVMDALILVESKEASLVAAKDIAKEAKEDMEVAERELRQLIKDREAQRGKKPQPKQSSIPYPDPSTGHNAAAPDLREPSEVPVPEDDSWKAVPLTDLILHGLPAKIVDILASPVHKERGAMSPITTMGELATYSAPEPNGWTKKITDIKGLGPQKEELLSDATADFWKRWNAANATRSRDAQEAGSTDVPVDGGQPGAVGGDDPKPEDGQPAIGAAGSGDADAASTAPADGPNADEPEGYQTETSKRIGERLKEQQAQ